MNILLSIYVFLFLFKKLNNYKINNIYKTIISLISISVFFFQSNLLFYLQIQILFIFWISICKISKRFIFLWIVSSTLIFFNFTNIVIKEEYIYTAYLILFSIPFFLKKNDFIIGFMIISLPICFFISVNCFFSFSNSYYIGLIIFLTILLVYYIFINSKNSNFIRYSIYLYLLSLVFNISNNSNNYQDLLIFFLVFIVGSTYLFEYFKNKNSFLLTLMPIPGFPLFLILAFLDINNIFSNILIIFSLIYSAKTVSFIIDNYYTFFINKIYLKQISIIICFSLLNSILFYFLRSNICLYFF